ncbi:unnamed protein product [Diamesa tonsa]
MDLINSLKYVIIVQRCYRLAVFKIDKLRGKLVTSNLEVTLSYGIIAFVILEMTYAAYALFSENTVAKEDAPPFNILDLIKYIETVLTVASGIFFTIVAIRKRHNQINFIERVEKIDKYIKTNLQLNVNYREYQLISLSFLIVVLVYYNLVFSFTSYFLILDLTTLGGHFMFVTYISTTTLSAIFTYGFICYVALIKDRFQIINRKLGKMVGGPLQSPLKKNKKSLCVEMIKFTKMYKSLCGGIDDINKIYGFSMVLHFAHDFTLLTSQIFGIFYISFGVDWHEFQIWKIFGLFIWLLPNMLKMTGICLVCHLTRNQANRCSKYLKKFSNEASEDELVDMVDMFALQSIHSRTEFTASNFFPIDMSLFFTIISATTTYLVILIQFKNYEDEKETDVKDSGNFTNSTVI